MFNPRHSYLLLKCDLFKNIQRDELFNLMEDISIRIEYFETNSIIMSKENYNNEIGFLIEGAIGVKSRNQEDHFIFLILPNQMVGDNYLYSSNGVEIIEYEAMTSCTVIFMDKNDFKKMIKRKNWFVYNFTNEVSRKINDQMYFQYIVNTPATKERVLLFLKFIMSKYSNYPVIKFPKKRKDLARLLNVSSENLIRCVKSLESEGYINTQGKSIIVNREKM